MTKELFDKLHRAVARYLKAYHEHHNNPNPYDWPNNVKLRQALADAHEYLEEVNRECEAEAE